MFENTKFSKSQFLTYEVTEVDQCAFFNAYVGLAHPNNPNGIIFVTLR